jgi:hypothetical protein
MENECDICDSVDKHEHWRGLQAEKAWRSAPVPEFDVLGRNHFRPSDFHPAPPVRS